MGADRTATMRRFASAFRFSAGYRAATKTPLLQRILNPTRNNMICRASEAFTPCAHDAVLSSF
jgi:hypothetical protein